MPWIYDLHWKDWWKLWFYVPVIIILIGCLLNSNNEKFGRFRDESCRRGIFSLDTENRFSCCDSMPPDMITWVQELCEVSYSPTGKFMATFASWWLPLIPGALLCLIECCSSQFRNSIKIIAHHLRRILFYLLLFIFRTFVLYFGGSWAQTRLQTFFNDMSHSENCWYSHLTRGCKGSFDFSDHIVLFVVHYR
jgi:hypothetical protein